MNPTWMLTMLVALSAAFAWSANRRWQLLKVGRSENRSGNLIERLKGTYEYAFVQKKMGYYPLAGLAHKLIFVGFLVLLLRSLMLWGRGFDPAFSFWVLNPVKPAHLPLVGDVPLGEIYEFLKDVTALLVLFGALVFVYFRAHQGGGEDDALGRGHAHPRHHHRHDARRHGLRRRLPRPLAPLRGHDLHGGRRRPLHPHPRPHGRSSPACRRRRAPPPGTSSRTRRARSPR